MLLMYFLVWGDPSCLIYKAHTVWADLSALLFAARLFLDTKDLDTFEELKFVAVSKLDVINQK